MGWSRSLALAALLALGCADPPRVVEQGEALLAAGKLEEAADKFAAACAVAPGRADCAALDQRAAEARVDAAQRAMAEGRYLAAERLLLLATMTASAPARDRAVAKLGEEELATGRRYEIALALPDKHQTHERMLAVAREQKQNEATKRAAAWIEKEWPAVLAADVEAACKPDAPPAVSCAEAYAELRKVGGSGPAFEAAAALARAEAARVYPLRVKAEQMIAIDLAYGRADRRLAQCMTEPAQAQATEPPDGGAPEDTFAACKRTVFPGDAAEQRDKHDRAFQELLAEIRDPGVVAEISARRDKALAEGKIDKITIEKPEGVKP